MARQHRGGFVFRERDGQHGAFSARAFVHEPGAQDDDAGRLLHTQDAGHAGGGDFTDAVAGDRRWRHAARLPQFGQRDLHGENRWLGDLGLHQSRFGLVAREFLEQGKPRPRFHGAGAGFHGAAEHRLAAHQLAPHPPPLRPLPAHDESHARRLLGPRSEGRAEARVAFAGGKSAQSLREPGRRPLRQRQPIRMVIAARAERVRQIRQQRGMAIALFVCLDPVRQPARRRLKRAFGARGEHDRPRAFRIDQRGGSGRGRGRFREDDVRIGAAEAE